MTAYMEELGFACAHGCVDSCAGHKGWDASWEELGFHGPQVIAEDALVAVRSAATA